jgi:hypothetical protein
LLVILTVFGFIGCDDDNGDGTLTITDIPVIYENNYAYFIAESPSGGEFWGAQNISMSGITLVQIKNSSVVLPMWEIASSGQWSRYSGNNTINNGKLLIFSTLTVSGDSLISMIDLKPFTFSNGNASISAE